MSMNVIHLGSGAGAPLWVQAVQRYPGGQNAGRVPDDSTAAAVVGAALPEFRTLSDAMGNVSADVAVVSGVEHDWATQALQANLAVVMDEAGSVDAAAFRKLHSAANAKPSIVLWPRRYRYARCERMVKRMVDSGRLGGIGHVACVGQTSQASSRAFSDFQSLRHLFGASPKKVMARLGRGSGSLDFTEAFLELESGLHIHYSAYGGAQRDTHELWIEGAEGSLKTDGGAVWWRKRGWRFFLPLELGPHRRCRTRRRHGRHWMRSKRRARPRAPRARTFPRSRAWLRPSSRIVWAPRSPSRRSRHERVAVATAGRSNPSPGHRHGYGGCNADSAMGSRGPPAEFRSIDARRKLVGSRDSR